MGDAASLAEGVTLRATLAAVRGLEESAQPPRTLRLLRATQDGWLEVSRGNGDLSVTVDEPGAYRAEVRMRPEHLRPSLGSFIHLADSDFVWIYANPIYVTQ